MEIARDIHIARPVEEVFAYVADPANDPAWLRAKRRDDPRPAYRVEADRDGARITIHDDARSATLDEELQTLKRLLEHDNDHC